MVPRSSVRVGRSTLARKNSSDRLKGAEFFGREMSSPTYDATLARVVAWGPCTK